MKCQRCAKQATYHITEVLGDEKFDELHLCEDCAKKYFNEPGQAGKKPAVVALARKVLVRCWAMLRDGVPWRDEPAPLARAAGG